ncbi:MAG: acyltransferase family protein, partial [Verrucomicrobiales bacterium]
LIIGLSAFLLNVYTRLEWREFFDRTLIGQLPFFLLGFLLCDLYLSGWLAKKGRPRLWDVCGLVAWFAIPWCVFSPKTGTHPPLWAGLLVLPLLLFFAYAAVFRGHYLRRFFALRWPVLLGGMCYTIYLFHNQVLQLLVRLVPIGSLPENFWLRLPVLVLFCVVVFAFCALLFLLLERPFMDRHWPRKWGRTIRHTFRSSADSSVGGERSEP